MLGRTIGRGDGGDTAAARGVTSGERGDGVGRAVTGREAESARESGATLRIGLSLAGTWLSDRGGPVRVLARGTCQRWLCSAMARTPEAGT